MQVNPPEWQQQQQQQQQQRHCAQGGDSPILPGNSNIALNLSTDGGCVQGNSGQGGRTMCLMCSGLLAGV
jgi:hypothetical protein